MHTIDSFINQHKMKFGISIVLLIGLFIVLQIISGNKEHNEAKEQPFEKSIEVVSSEKIEQPVNEEIMVDVKGAVKYNGVYPAKKNQRVVDILELAVPLKNADIEAVNLADELSDQMVIYVPYKGEVKEEKYAMYHQSSSTQDKSQPVININEASESELQNIPGIGPKKAQEIISYREANGGFKSKEEIKEIKGIGDKTYAALEPFIEL